VVEEYQLYSAEHAGRSRAARDPDGSGRGACRAPCGDGEWNLLLRWENLIDRGMERTFKLYLLMRRLGRQTKSEEIWHKNRFLRNEAVNLLKTQGRGRNEPVNEPEEGARKPSTY